MRIVSLVPAATDIVAALGLGRELVGVSHECDPGDDVARATLTRSLVDTSRLSSAEIDAAIAARAATGSPLYDIDAGHLADLRPDLILTQGLCDVCALPARTVTDALPRVSSQSAVVSLDARSIDSMLASIVEIGRRTDRASEADALVTNLRCRIERVAAAVRRREVVSTVCLEWLDPPYASGHWIPEMVARAGGHDLLGRPGIPSIPIDWSAVAHAGAAVVIVMPCGYDLPRATRDVASIAERAEWKDAVGDARVFVASGSGYFTRPGPRLVTGIEVLAAVFHPDVVAWPLPPGVIAPWP